MTSSDIERAANEFLSGELALGGWFEASDGRYQLQQIARTQLVDKTMDVPIPHIRLTMVRKPIAERIAIEVTV